MLSDGHQIGLGCWDCYTEVGYAKQESLGRPEAPRAENFHIEGVLSP